MTSCYFVLDSIFLTPWPNYEKSQNNPTAKVACGCHVNVFGRTKSTTRGNASTGKSSHTTAGPMLTPRSFWSLKREVGGCISCAPSRPLGRALCVHHDGLAPCATPALGRRGDLHAQTSRRPACCSRLRVSRLQGVARSGRACRRPVRYPADHVSSDGLPAASPSFPRSLPMLRRVLLGSVRDHAGTCA